ncbi:MAG: hypothetical protein HFF72_14240, partial [Oscillospiraceae bacterium]|nr:hypothetical protein [Oscillospiraceae bacterium]
MLKRIPKRYISEEAVKRALKIDSFRNLSKDKVMQFASMIPYMDRDVAIAIINQFPGPDRKFCVNADKLSSRKEEQLRGFFGLDTGRLN